MEASKRDFARPLSAEEVEHQVGLFLSRVGARVRELRTAQDIRSADIQEEHGIGISRVSDMENGKANITIRSAVRLAVALGVEPWDFFIPADDNPIQPKPSKRARLTSAQEKKAVKAFQQQFGARVRELRELQGMSLLALESLSGIDQTALSKIEVGSANIRASTAIQLADAIGVQPHELYIPSERSGIRPKRRRRSKR